MSSIANEHSLEVARYPLTDLEKDALNNFPGPVSLHLIKTLRDSVSVFHNLAHELWKQGMRIRVIPKGRRYVDIKEFANEDPDFMDGIPGIYNINRRLVVVREEELLESTLATLKYATFIHEIAHAIWFILLWENDREYINRLYEKEKQRFPEDTRYRMKNVYEFFAESFVYYVTPHRKGKILGIDSRSFGKQKIRIVTKEMEDPSREDLKNSNVDMLAYLESRFKNLIDPELVMARPNNPWEEERFERWRGDLLFLPVTHSTEKGERFQNW